MGDSPPMVLARLARCIEFPAKSSAAALGSARHRVESMDLQLHSHRLKLPNEDVAAIARQWARWRQSARRHLDLPQDITCPLGRLAACSGVAAPLWLEAMLLIDLHGRIMVESGHPVRAWFSTGKSLPASGSPVWTLPEAWFEDVRAIERVNDGQLGVAVRRRMLRQLLGKESPEHLAHVVDTAWQVDDTSLTIWLPDKAAADAKALAEHLDFTLSDLIRNTLFLHLWGRVGYAECLADGRWRQKRRSQYPDMEAMFSYRRVRVLDGQEAKLFHAGASTDTAEEEHVPRRVERIAEHGKSASAYKIWLPTAMKNRLAFWSQGAGLRISDHCREVVLQALYGHRTSRPDQA